MNLKNMNEEEKKAHKREIHRLHQKKYYSKNKDYYKNYQKNWFKKNLYEKNKLIESLKERIAYLERSNNRREDEIMSLRDELIENEYELNLKHTKKVFDTLAYLINKGETCTYRYLIYDLLGFDLDAYIPLISGLTITNMLVDYQELRGENNE